MLYTLCIVIFRSVTQTTRHLHFTDQIILAQTFLFSEPREIGSVTILFLYTYIYFFLSASNTSETIQCLHTCI